MAKATGMSMTTLGVGDATNTVQDIRNDITNWQVSTPRAVQDVTGVDKAAVERLLLLVDCSIQLNGVMNTAANKSHAVLSSAPSTSVLRTVNMTINGANLNQAAAILFTDYQLTRAQDGSALWQAPGVLGSGAVPTWS